MELGLRIKEIRESKGISQRELARRLKLKQSSVSNYESGNREPSLEILVKIANILEVSTDYLLTGKEKEIRLSKKEYQFFMELFKLIKSNSDTFTSYEDRIIRQSDHLNDKKKK